MEGFAALGFEHSPSAIPLSALSRLAEIAAGIPSDAGGRRWAGAELAALLADPGVDAVVRMVDALMPDAHVLRIVAFKKDPGANWFVPAHQDRSIPIPSSKLPPGFSRPTRKGDGWQAEAPIDVLQAMRNIRVFIDPATTDDGPLEVVPGTHRLGRIEQAAIPALADESKWHPLIGNAGDVAILSPLLLHRSRRATQPRGRRVLQIECVPQSIRSTYEMINQGQESSECGVAISRDPIFSGRGGGTS
jgi:ectoine hydroxylase-related dioxygenase (phytanoyl-CoA dioxygenase family)